MNDYKLGTIESKFADIIWSREPMTSRELVAVCTKELDWKKSTTYTVLKKLCDRGLFQNQEGLVTSLISRDEFYARQSEQFVEESFSGSLPSFLAAFTKRRNLTSQEVAQIRAMIDAYGEE